MAPLVLQPDSKKINKIKTRKNTFRESGFSGFFLNKLHNKINFILKVCVVDGFLPYKRTVLSQNFAFLVVF